MFDFFEDVFHFLMSEVPAAAEDSSNAVEETAHSVFDAWQDSTNDFFHQLNNAAANWGDPAQNFVAAWQDATESFADQYAGWWGWNNDNSPV